MVVKPIGSENDEMPVMTIDGRNYIGHLEIPKLNKKLPVGASFIYDQLKLTPALFSGSYYDNSMIICAHNYPTHFGELESLNPGDIVQFANSSSRLYQYQITNIEIMEPTEIGRLTAEGDWDLTLFTCTFDT